MKRLDIIALYKNHNVPFITTGNKHCLPGWVQTNCCFCMGPRNYHLGFNMINEYFNCWRCGWHPLDAVIATILKQTIYEARNTIQEYRTGKPTVPASAPIEIKRPTKIEVPGGTLMKPHLDYLKKRGFDNESIEWLVSTYKLKGTGPVGPDSFRIVAPIYFDGNLVSYQGRDYTEKSPLKYKACPKSLEIRDHKDCLYAMDLVKGDTVVIVEGIVDAWKLGPGAVATFGSAFTWAQVRLLVERWNRHVILFDPDADIEIHKLATAISGLCKTTTVAILKGWKDPGELTLEKGEEIMKKIMDENKK